MGMDGKSLVLMVVIQNSINSVNKISKSRRDSQNLVGMTVHCSFQTGLKYQGIFLTGDEFLADFSSGWGPTGSVTRGCEKV